MPKKFTLEVEQELKEEHLPSRTFNPVTGKREKLSRESRQDISRLIRKNTDAIVDRDNTREIINRDDELANSVIKKKKAILKRQAKHEHELEVFNLGKKELDTSRRAARDVDVLELRADDFDKELRSKARGKTRAGRRMHPNKARKLRQKAKLESGQAECEVVSCPDYSSVLEADSLFDHELIVLPWPVYSYEFEEDPPGMPALVRDGYDYADFDNSLFEFDDEDLQPGDEASFEEWLLRHLERGVAECDAGEYESTDYDYCDNDCSVYSECSEEDMDDLFNQFSCGLVAPVTVKEEKEFDYDKYANLSGDALYDLPYVRSEESVHSSEEDYVDEPIEEKCLFDMYDNDIQYNVFEYPFVKRFKILRLRKQEFESYREFYRLRRDHKRLGTLQGLLRTVIDMQAILLRDLFKQQDFDPNRLLQKMCDDGITDVMGNVKAEVAVIPDSFWELFEQLKPIFDSVVEVAAVYGPFIVFLYQIYRARSMLDCAAALFAMCTSVGISNKIDIVAIKNALFSKYNNIFEYVVLSNNTGEAEAWADEARSSVTLISKIYHSDVITAIRNIVLSLASYKWFDRDITSQLFSYFGKPHKLNVLQTVELCVEQLIILLRVGDKLREGKSLVDIFVAGDPVVEMDKKLTELLYYSDKLYTGLPVEGQMDYSQFVTSMREAVDTTKTILESANPLLFETRNLSKKFYSAREVLVEAINCMNSSMRPPPMGVVIHGDPGVGKSRVTPFVAEIWSRVKGRDFDVSQIFHRVVSSQYWEGFQPMSHWCVHYSELGNKRPETILNKGDPMLDELNSLMDSIPFNPDMAFDNKGKYFARPELVVIDTNDYKMNIDKLYKNKAAFFRRFLFLEVFVKPEFRREGGTGIDTAKSLASDEPAMNRYLFKLVMYVTEGVDVARPIELMNGSPDDDIYALVKVLEDYFTKFIENQDQVQENMSKTTVRDYERGAAEVDALPNPFVYGWNLHGQFWYNFWMNYVNEGINAASAIWQWFIMVCIAIGWLLGYFLLSFVLYYKVPALEWKIYAIDIVIWFQCALMLYVSRYLKFLVFLLLIVQLLLRSEDFYSSIYGIFTRRLDKKKSEMWARLRYLLFFKVLYSPLDSAFWIKYQYILMPCSLALSTLSMAFVIGKAVECFTTKDKNKDDRVETYVGIAESSSFRVFHPVNEALNDLEEKYDCGESYERIPIVGTELWNVRQIVTQPCAHHGTFDSLYARIARNVRPFVLQAKDRGDRRSTLMGLCGNIALMNTHVFHTDCTDFVLRVSNTWKHESSVLIDTHIDGSNRRDLGNDLSLVVLSGINFKDITSHLSDDEFVLDSYEGYFKSLKLRVKPTRDLKAFDIKDEKSFVVTNLLAYRYADHRVGLCGTPLLVRKNKGICIAGIHVGYFPSSDTCFSIILDKETIMEGIDLLQSDPIMMPIASEGNIAEGIVLEGPHFKSPFCHEELPGLNYFGKEPGDVHLNQKSNLIHTKIWKEVKEIFSSEDFIIDTEFGPPQMKPKTVDGDWISPWNLALRKISSQRGTLNRKIVRKVVRLLTNRIVNQLRKRGTPKWSPLTIEAAINGVYNDPFIKRINASTSGGYGFKGPKGEHIPLVFETTREATEELKLRIKYILDTYEQGNTICVVNAAQLKDEPREISKVQAGKTRVFYMTPLDFLVVSRMFASPFYSSMVEHGDIFGSCVGINMFSSAEKLFEELKSFSPLIMEGDYENYDQKMPFDIGHAACSVVYNVCKYMGYNDRALVILSGVLTDTLFPFILMNLDLMECPGLQPSGRYATAEDNCLRGLIMMMVCWYSFTETKDLDFFKYVLPRLYGDDMLAAVKPEVGAFFNNLTYKGFCESVYLLGFTSPNKSQKMEFFTTVEECSFLKRKFKWREDLGRHTAVLNVSSIVRSLQWIIPSRHVPVEEQVRGALISALWELFQHCEESRFNRMRDKLTELVSREYYDGEVLEVPTFHEINNRIEVAPVGLPEISLCDDEDICCSGMLLQEGIAAC